MNCDFTQSGSRSWVIYKRCAGNWERNASTHGAKYPAILASLCLTSSSEGLRHIALRVVGFGAIGQVDGPAASLTCKGLTFLKNQARHP